jgi:solute carrier family 25 protein 39/40
LIYSIKVNLLFSDNPRDSCSTWKTIRKIYAQGGVKGLFTGLTPRLVKVAPACAIMISTFEYGKSFFQTYNANHAIVDMSDNIQWLGQKRDSV